MGSGEGSSDRVSRRVAPALRWVTAMTVPLLLAAWTLLHTELESSVPADGSVLEAAPESISLDYTTDVQLELSRVSVTDAQGNTVEVAPLAFLSEDRHDVLVAGLPGELPAGVYRVQWTTAGPDGHALTGEISFTVEAPPPPAGQDSSDQAVEAPQEDTASVTVEAPSGDRADPNAGRGATGARWLMYLGIVGVLGAVSFRFLVLPQILRGGELPEVAKGATTTLWRVVGVGAAAILLSAPFRLWYQVRSFYGNDDESPVNAFFTIATQGPWGRGWLLSLGVGLLVGAGFLLSRPKGQRNPGWGVIAIGALILPMVPVLSGHAWGRSPQGLAIAADFLHIVAAGTWVGGLLCLVVAGLPALKAHGVKEGSGQPGLPGMVGAFSRVAVASVAVLALSGALNSWLHMESFGQLWTTPWGKALLAKLAVVVGVLGLGFYNWRFVRPALQETPRPGLLKAPAFLELALGILALVLTSFLVVQPLN